MMVAPRILRVVERALLIVAISSLGLYGTVRIAAAREQAALSRELTTAYHAAAPVTPTAALAPRALVGRVEIRRLRLSAVAREGVDESTLALAIGHVPGTALPGAPGNAAFAAHRDTFFRPLKHVRPGDQIVVTTKAAAFRYAVTETRVVEPGDVAVLDPTVHATLTLITCYPFEFIGSAPKRFVVRAALESDR